jgi:hypothetical protein
MSAPIEMTANAVPIPAPPPLQHKAEETVKDRPGTAGSSDAVVQDSASLRAEKVSMASEEVSSAPTTDTYSVPDHIDVYV